MSSNLTSKEKVFKSLNCAKCKKPFLIDYHARAPQRVWVKKSLYICRECFDCEKVKKKGERWKPIGDNAFQKVYTVKCLLDLIADDSLQMNESKTGYIIAKEPFVVPRCPVCLETYQIADPMKSPYDLYCHHVVCFRCYYRMRTDRKDPNPKYPNLSFEIVCSTCQIISYTSGSGEQNNALKDFLLELPGMIEQYKITKALRVAQSSAQCSTCPRKTQINEMHYCVDCKVEICVHCAFSKHRLHDVNELAKERAKAIAEETDQVTANQVDTYEKMFNHLQSELIQKITDLKLKFKESANSITELDDYDMVIEKRNEFRQFGKRFEEISEAFVPSFRILNTELESLLNKFSK